ncbi:MAG: ABC transporter ATP-binding protein [Rhodomicrobium sp.]|nr:MAG: ABC transporter ATP-binding protein [Rhodomicrobium sp.]
MTMNMDPNITTDAAPSKSKVTSAAEPDQNDTHNKFDTADTVPAISVESVSYNYGQRKALDDVSFKVWPGRFTALLGANGAGKSTLLSLITRLFDTGVGQIVIDGKSFKQYGAAALAPLGVVFQQTTLDMDLTVRQNLKYFARLRGMTASKSKQRIEETLTSLDMFERVDEKVRDLNGGHRRRVEIARAMLHEPKLLLLDEPTVGLDIQTRRIIVEHIHKLASNSGVAVLWTTHLMDEIRQDDELIVLDKGRIIEEGPVNEVLARAGSPSIEDAFEALIIGEKERL